jgi:hypothetical protein
VVEGIIRETVTACKGGERSDDGGAGLLRRGRGVRGQKWGGEDVKQGRAREGRASCAGEHPTAQHRHVCAHRAECSFVFELACGTCIRIFLESFLHGFLLCTLARHGDNKRRGTEDSVKPLRCGPSLSASTSAFTSKATCGLQKFSTNGSLRPPT